MTEVQGGHFVGSYWMFDVCLFCWTEYAFDDLGFLETMIDTSMDSRN